MLGIVDMFPQNYLAPSPSVLISEKEERVEVIVSNALPACGAVATSPHTSREAPPTEHMATQRGD